MTVELWNGEEGKNEYSVSNSNPFNVNVSRGDNNLPKPFTEVKSIASNRSYYNCCSPLLLTWALAGKASAPPSVMWTSTIAFTTPSGTRTTSG